MLINVLKYTVIGKSGSVEKHLFVSSLAKFLQATHKLPTTILDLHSDDERWYTDTINIESTIDLFISKPKLLRSKCIYCARCAKNCEYNAISFQKSPLDVTINYDKCVGCSLCLNFCEKDALEEVHCEIGVINEYAITPDIHLLEGVTPNDFFYPHMIIKALEKRIEPDSIVINNVSLTDDDLIEELAGTSDLFICFISDKSELEAYNPFLDAALSSIIVCKTPFDAHQMKHKVVILDENFSFDSLLV